MSMLILQADGIQLTLVMLTTSTQERGLSFDMLAVPYFGRASFKLRLHFQWLKLSILHYLKLWGRQFLWWIWWKRSTLSFHCIFLNLNLLSKFKKTISHALQWQITPNFLLGPSILQSSIIIFKSMWLLNQILRDSFQLATAQRMIRLQISSLNLSEMISFSGYEIWYSTGS